MGKGELTHWPGLMHLLHRVGKCSFLIAVMAEYKTNHQYFTMWTCLQSLELFYKNVFCLCMLQLCGLMNRENTKGPRMVPWGTSFVKIIGSTNLTMATKIQNKICLQIMDCTTALGLLTTDAKKIYLPTITIYFTTCILLKCFFCPILINQ